MWPCAVCLEIQRERFSGNQLCPQAGCRDRWYQLVEQRLVLGCEEMCRWCTGETVPTPLEQIWKGRLDCEALHRSEILRFDRCQILWSVCRTKGTSRAVKWQGAWISGTSKVLHLQSKLAVHNSLGSWRTRFGHKYFLWCSFRSW